VDFFVPQQRLFSFLSKTKKGCIASNPNLRDIKTKSHHYRVNSHKKLETKKTGLENNLGVNEVTPRIFVPAKCRILV